MSNIGWRACPPPWFPSWSLGTSGVCSVKRLFQLVQHGLLPSFRLFAAAELGSRVGADESPGETVLIGLGLLESLLRGGQGLLGSADALPEQDRELTRLRGWGE